MTAAFGSSVTNLSMDFSSRTARNSSSFCSACCLRRRANACSPAFRFWIVSAGAEDVVVVVDGGCGGDDDDDATSDCTATFFLEGVSFPNPFAMNRDDVEVDADDVKYEWR